MTPLIVGAGAIGLLAASRLALAQQPAPIRTRQSPSGSFNLTFRDQGRDYPLLLRYSQPDDVYSHVLVCTKAYDVVAAVAALQAQLKQDACIVLCHNGMGTHDAVQATLQPKQQLWFASTTHAALRQSPHLLIHTGHGATRVGPLNSAAKACDGGGLIDWLQRALGPLILEANIEHALWHKLAINAVINPLTALHQCRNGELAKPEFTDEIQHLLREFVAIAAAAGFDFEQESLSHDVYQVMARTAQNRSSMAEDVRLHRRTELAAITGFVLEQAAQANINAPHHAALYQALADR